MQGEWAERSYDRVRKLTRQVCIDLCLCFCYIQVTRLSQALSTHTCTLAPLKASQIEGLFRDKPSRQALRGCRDAAFSLAKEVDPLLWLFVASSSDDPHRLSSPTPDIVP
jgi:hypothetical protein